MPTHPIPHSSDLPEKLEVVESLQETLPETIARYLKPVAECWQPADYLPDLAQPGGAEQMRQLREESLQIPDELLVALIGDMITEEALPSYQTWINGLDGFRDKSGEDASPWAVWSRGWTAEENRHGDLLNKYLYLTGRVDMRAVETTIQHLIRNGFNPLTGNDPYHGLIYTSFQECATKISHRNVAIQASRAGSTRLRDICGVISGDEARHEKFYQACMKEIFEEDPARAVLALAHMMEQGIIMPARLMGAGGDRNLFLRFSGVAERIGIYTMKDYADILEHLLRLWGVRKLAGLTGESARAQDHLCGLPERYARAAERRRPGRSKAKFSWLYDREI